MVISDFPRRLRPDACPGALQVHTAADGGLARVRIPGGRLTASQLRELARAASDLGTGVVELTSRANVQVRGLAGEGRADFAARVAGAGLLPAPTHERVRNILASPLTGCDTAGVLDVDPLVAELDRRLCARPALAELPGRFLFALDDGRCDVVRLDPDAGILPLGDGEAALVLAGADSGLRVPVDRAVTALLTAAEAFLAVAAAAGGERAWRIGELPGGAEPVARRVRAVLGSRVTGGARPDPRWEPTAARRPATPVGVAGRSGGRVALGVAVPLGRLTRAQAELLAALAPSGEIRLTPWRGAVLPGLESTGAAAALARLADAGLITDPASPWIGVTACAGRPGCARALADVRSDAARAASPDRPAHAGTVPVHWAGCERRCGRPRGRVADVVATVGGYRVELDGRSREYTGVEETAAAVAALRGDG